MQDRCLRHYHGSKLQFWCHRLHKAGTRLECTQDFRLAIKLSFQKPLLAIESLLVTQSQMTQNCPLEILHCCFWLRMSLLISALVLSFKFSSFSSLSYSRCLNTGLLIREDLRSYFLSHHRAGFRHHLQGKSFLATAAREVYQLLWAFFSIPASIQPLFTTNYRRIQLSDP